MSKTSKTSPTAIPKTAGNPGNAGSAPNAHGPAKEISVSDSGLQQTPIGSEARTASKQTTQYKKEMRERAKMERNSRPLVELSRREKQIGDYESYRSRLRNAPHATPDPNLAIRQIIDAVGEPGLGSHLDERIKKESLDLFAALGSKDAIDSMLDRQLVGLHYATMGCLKRAAQTNSTKARDVELRHAVKGMKAGLELVKFRESRVAEEATIVAVDIEHEATEGGDRKSSGRRRTGRKASVARPQRRTAPRKLKSVKTAGKG
jgi:hypothetical protein